MHVGRADGNCPRLQIHGVDMPNTDEISYLGDLITADGKNIRNIKDRTSKGLGLISQIFSVIKLTSFGNCTYEIALLLRNSILISGMMTNVETWYNIKESDIDEFEKIDKLYLLKLFEAPRSTPSVALFLELDC